MPAGELYTREIRSSDTPENLHRRVVVQLSPLLAPANYKLATQDPQHVEYSRRYLPTAALVGGGLSLVAALVAVLTGAAAVAVVLGAIGALVLLARRREELRVAVQPCPGGSTAFLSGYLTGRARMSVVAFDPPRRSRSIVVGAHAGGTAWDAG